MSTAPNQFAARRRIILLGASNVTLAFPVILRLARQFCGGPVEFLGAFGHGRSYGERHAVLWRELPGIVECGLWPALQRLPAAPTTALVTDIGNDLLFEVPVTTILGWVETCLDHLQRLDAKIVLTPLPLCSIRSLRPAKYLLLRSLIFPGSGLPLGAALERAHDLDARLRTLASERGVAIAEPRTEWYGFDCIHLRRSCWEAAWNKVLSLWSLPPALPRCWPARLRDELRLRLFAPERRWLFGVEQRTVQPAGRLADGTTISLY